MRASIHIDSADTGTVRRLAIALHNVGLTGTLTVGVNGPDAWTATTPMLSPDQFTTVAAAVGS